ncbi:MAG: NAD(+) diphosphatase [Lachnospiraceae bacterium]
MFQDIEPFQFHNEYRKQEPKDTDYVIITKGETVLTDFVDDQVMLPTVGQLPSAACRDALIYLFSVDEQAYFWLDNQSPEAQAVSTPFSWQEKFKFRGKIPKETAFAASVGFHLGSWYERNRFCGKCGKPFQHKDTERALFCPHCNNVLYPKISPAMIVAILHDGKILLSRYSDGYYRKHALIAGYCEAGETLEQCVHREVMEETGLKVKNLRYFKSQPWPFTGSLLMGFFADLDGDDTVTLDRNELCEAVWFDREHLPKEDNTLSLTWTMIEYFRSHPEL